MFYTLIIGSLLVLFMCSNAGVMLFDAFGIEQSWRGDFIFPSVIALLIAVFCWWAIRDTPESCGLPSVQDWRKD